MRNVPRKRAAGAIVAVALLATGCASAPPPTEQMAVSRAAVASAVGAGAPEYAAAEMRIAQEKMDRAHQAMEKREYVIARRYAEEAEADARLAEKKAQTVKAERAANAMQDDLRVLRDEMNRKTR